MSRSPLANVRPGEKLRIAASTMNDMLAMVRERGRNTNGDGIEWSGETPTSVKVRNSTGGNLPRFSVLGIDGNVLTLGGNNDSFNRLVLDGVAPTATSSIVVTQDAISDGKTGAATALGLTVVQVNLTSTAHRSASPTTLTTQLTSGASGTAKILAIEDDFTATGVKWAVVLLMQTAFVITGWVRFSLPSALATTDASKASCTVDDYWGNVADPGSTVTVYNLPASTDYIFSGITGAKGLAVWDDIDSKWWIVQLECTGDGSSASIAINSTPVSGGDVDGLIYTDGSLAQTASGTRVASEKLEVKLDTDRWLAFAKGSL